MKEVAILVWDGFNELDVFGSMTMLNRLSARGLRADILGPAPEVISMNGVLVRVQKNWTDVSNYDAVLITSGNRTDAFTRDPNALAQLKLAPQRQLIASQCSGALVLARKGILRSGATVSTDEMTAPLLRAEGFEVAEAPLTSSGNLATAGGCLSFVYLSAWIIRSLAPGLDWRSAVRSIAPVGEDSLLVDRVERAVGFPLPKDPLVHAGGAAVGDAPNLIGG